MAFLRFRVMHRKPFRVPRLQAEQMRELGRQAMRLNLARWDRAITLDYAALGSETAGRCQAEGWLGGLIETMNGAQRPDSVPFQDHIRSVGPDALKIPARRAVYSLTESARYPFHAEPTQENGAKSPGETSHLKATP